MDELEEFLNGRTIGVTDGRLYWLDVTDGGSMEETLDLDEIGRFEEIIYYLSKRSR